MKNCLDCRHCEPWDEFVKTPMCAVVIPRHYAEIQRLPTGDCKPEGLLFEARK